MNLIDIVLLGAVLALGIYLLFALLHPEKF
ncbi:K+-transporting ATPase KdpF subunit [Luteibacter sp. Sphag1AF]|nr:K(+)-transporting ATPase subunit F [Luteibacter sp. Sphag1AF]MBB3227651.1 K+-transporting ATPase KdpF subunit [Luteibacter sp. Sphag1AF]